MHGHKRIEPQVWQTRISPRIIFKDSTCTWSKDDWPPQVWQTRISPRIFFKDSTCAWSEDDWPSPGMPDKDLTQNFFKDSTCAWSKDDWPPQVWQTRISPRIFLKIQHVHGQKMIEPQVWQTRISPRIIFKDSTCAWSKDDWPPRYDRPRSHLEFFLKIQHVHGHKMIEPRNDRPGSHLEFSLNIQHMHGHKMIEPQVWQTRISPRIIFKDSTCTWSKDDWPPPRYDRPGSHLEFFLKIQHVHGQKMIDPPRYARQGSHLEFF